MSNMIFIRKRSETENTPILKASLLEKDTLPSFLFGVIVTKRANNAWAIKTDEGEQMGFPKEAYWVYYGKKSDGAPIIKILSKTDENFKNYIVCDENGTEKCSLSEFYAR